MGQSSPRPTPADVAALRRRIASLHGLGWSDRGIGEAVGRHRTTVYDHRHLMNLPANPYGAFAKRRRAAGVRQWLKSIGVRSKPQFRQDLGRIAAARLGWPIGVTLAEARLLAALRAGPLTLAELAKRLGLRYQAGTNCGTHRMAQRLAARGLIDKGWQRGRSRRVRIYRLARDVLARRKIWEAGRT